MKYSFTKVKEDWYIYYDNQEIAYIDYLTMAIKNVRFTPGKEKILHIHQILWTMNSNQVFPCVWDYKTAEYDWELTDRGLILRLSALDQSKNMKCSAEVFFSNLNQDQRISIEISSKLEILDNIDWKGFLRQSSDGIKGIIEYTDPYPMHAVGPATTFSGYWSGLYVKGQETHTDNWRKRFKKIIYKKGENYIGYPLNHYAGINGLELDNQSIVGLFDDPLGALVYTMPKGKTNKQVFSLCLWGYDLHFDTEYDDVTDIDGRWGLLHFKKGESFSAEYNIDLLTVKQAKDIENITVYQEYTEEQIEAMNRPIITDGINRFNQACKPEDLFSFPWDYSANARWRKDIGYDDNFCIELDGRNEKSTINLNYGAENFGPTIKQNTRYRCYAMVKKLDKDAEVIMSFQFDVPIYKDYHSLPKDTTVYSVTLNSEASDFVMLELTGYSPFEHALKAVWQISATKGRVLVDNVYFGECIE